MFNFGSVRILFQLRIGCHLLCPSIFGRENYATNLLRTHEVIFTQQRVYHRYSYTFLSLSSASRISLICSDIFIEIWMKQKMNSEYAFLCIECDYLLQKRLKRLLIKRILLFFYQTFCTRYYCTRLILTFFWQLWLVLF